MIFVTGDTHIPYDIGKLSLKNFQQQKNLTRRDYVIILGDFGLYWKEDKTYKHWREILTKKNFTVLWLDGNHCFSSDTELLTNVGWRNVKDIYENIGFYRLASFDIDTGHIFYDAIDYRHRLYYDGNLVNLVGKDTEQLVTPDHDVVICNRKMRARECVKQEFRLSDIRNCGMRLGYHLNMSDDMIRLLVNVVCDGTLVLYSKYNKNSKKVRVQFKLSKQRKIEHLKELLERLGIRYTFKPCKKESVNKLQPYMIRIYGDDARMIAHLLHNKKEFPIEFRDMDARQAHILVEEISITDGTENRESRDDKLSVIWSSINKHDIDIVQEVCILNNISTFCKLDKYSSGFIADSSIYRLRIVEDKVRNTKISVSEVSYSGLVYCFSVKHGTLISRRNNKVAFTGNCNFDWIKTFPVTEWNGGKVQQTEDNIIHLMRGQVYNIDGLKFFTCGGATSIDKLNRIEGESWWKEEDISYAECEEALDNLDKAEGKVDYVLTHTCPQTLTQLMFNTKPIIDPTARFLDDIAENLEYKHWYFGHWHQDKKYHKFTCLYNKIERIK